MRFKKAFIPIITIFALSGCGSSSETAPPAAGNSVNRPAVTVNSAGNAINGANTANLANAVNAPVNQPGNTAAAPQTPSPTEVFKALGEAGGKKDLNSLVQLFNRRSMEMFASDARAQGKLMDEIMLNQRAVTVAKAAPAVRNEKISGDSATIEVKMPGGSWEKMYFTREDGVWKVAMDKYMDEMIRQVEESTKNLEKSADREGDK
jgi:hypothetical protein